MNTRRLERGDKQEEWALFSERVELSTPTNPVEKFNYARMAQVV